MVIEQLKITNFRCFSNYTTHFSPEINIITGLNASGKTSILEAIYCLGLIKSFRTFNQNELIKDGNDFFLIDGKVFVKQNAEQISVLGTLDGKRVKLNNYQYKRLSDFIGYFNVVCFSALDFLMLKGSSSERRKLFDLIICQISKDYVSLSNNYKFILKERNALLKRLMFENKDNLWTLLDVITKNLVDVGKQIIEIREKYIKEISDFAAIEHAKITDGKEQLNLVYVPCVTVLDFENKMSFSRQEDLKKGHTNFGPHRDDCIFIINNKNTAIYGSQGQQRNALLSVKLGMAQLLLKIKKDAPVLLLDDVFSELDKNRQNAIINSLSSDFQTIITAASITDLDQKIVDKSKVIYIERSV